MGLLLIYRNADSKNVRLCVTIPVLNEAARLDATITRLVGFLTQRLSLEPEIVIADNGSTDGTLAIAQSLARRWTNVRVAHFDEPGRGGALKRVWLASSADILSYMDADLSADLDAFPALIDPLAKGRYDLATGSRLLNPALTTRSFKREITSRCYNALVKVWLGTHFSDAQCGFKAITRRAAEHLLPLVRDEGWFFDTELLVLAEKLGYRIHDAPVKWVESRDSHVRILRTALDDLKGLWRLRRALRQPPPLFR
jgi:glycosyltransferase involved in cell wall biosynthesis